MTPPEPSFLAGLIGRGMIGGALLLAVGAAGSANPPGGSGTMAPPSPPAASDGPKDRHEPDGRRSRDRELDELDQMLNQTCGNNLVTSRNQNSCGKDSYGDSFGDIVAPPTGSEGSSDVLPNIPAVNRIENRNRDGQDSDEEFELQQSNTGGFEDTGNSCIGYECSAIARQDISGATHEEDSGSDDSSPPAAPVTNTDAGHAEASVTQAVQGGSGEITGYFNEDYTGRADVGNAGDAESSATQAVQGGSGEITGYFNEDYTGRSDVPPITPGNDVATPEITANVTLVPVEVDGGDAAASITQTIHDDKMDNEHPATGEPEEE